MLSNFTVKRILKQLMFTNIKILLAFMKPTGLSPFSRVSRWTLQTDKLQCRLFFCKMSLEIRTLMPY
jgi:hypothetical protein